MHPRTGHYRGQVRPITNGLPAVSANRLRQFGRVFSSGSRQILTRARRSTTWTSERFDGTSELTREVAPGTVRAYYAQVNTAIGWRVRDGLPEENYTRTVTKKSFPESDGREPVSKGVDRWEPVQITRYIDEQANDTVDEKEFDAIHEFRNRVLVSVRSISVSVAAKSSQINGQPTERSQMNDISLEDRMGVPMKRWIGCVESLDGGGIGR